ncbi:MAG TPA: DUF2332 family protein [Caulobacteraceae bacterium]
MVSMSDALLEAFDLQSHWCADLGSPFSAALLQRARENASAGGLAAALLVPWREASFDQVRDEAVALRFLGALHALVLGGQEPALAAAYPATGSGDAAQAWSVVESLLARRHDAIAAFMTHEPQTNEVRRSICLVGGFLQAAAEYGLPLRCFELGASAGLNQSWDKYRYQLGPSAWGDPDSPLHIDTDWTGAPPAIDARVEVIERRACDRRPIDLGSPDERLRLRAYVWADQRDRLRRLDAAIALALDRHVIVEAADAAVWVLQSAPRPGAVTVLYHSVFWQYVPAAGQAALSAAIESHGAAATPEGPFVWLRMEPVAAGFEVRSTTWPGGVTRTLAEVHPHGAWVKWLQV